HPRLEQTLLALVEPQVLVAETKTVPDVWVVVLSGRDGEGSRARPNLVRVRDRVADGPAHLDPVDEGVDRRDCRLDQLGLLTRRRPSDRRRADEVEQVAGIAPDEIGTPELAPFQTSRRPRRQSAWGLVSAGRVLRQPDAVDEPAGRHRARVG